jgi:hypothetical protein
MSQSATPASDSDNDLGAAAAWYAMHGIPVFPCKPRAKEPLTRHGFKDATTDLARVDSWWRERPDANIGIPTGAVSGLIAVDIDPRNAGNDSLDELFAKHGRFPDTAEQMTGGGGRHYVFKAPVVCKSKVLAPGIDLKGDGGYIVAAPSIHPSDAPYEWDGIAGEKALLKPADAPAWLLERIAASAKEKGATADRSPSSRAPRFRTRDNGETWRRGERNIRLTSLAGAVRRCGLCAAAMQAALLEENRQRCAPPLQEKEVKKIAGSVARYPVGAPLSGSSSPGAFSPHGYESALEALLDVVRFTADLPEFTILLFHVERSLGFGKQSDCTSLSQMTDGIFSQRLNTWIRKGCGRQKAAVIRANKALAAPDRQFLNVRRRSTPQSGNQPTEYEVNWEVLTRYIAQRKTEAIPPLVPQRDKPLVSKRDKALVSQRDTHNHYLGLEGE